MTRPLPLAEEIRAARARLEEAKRVQDRYVGVRVEIVDVDVRLRLLPADAPERPSLIARRERLAAELAACEPVVAEAPALAAAFAALQNEQRRQLEDPAWADEVRGLITLGDERHRLGHALAELTSRLRALDAVIGGIAGGRSALERAIETAEREPIPMRYEQAGRTAVDLVAGVRLTAEIVSLPIDLPVPPEPTGDPSSLDAARGALAAIAALASRLVGEAEPLRRRYEAVDRDFARVTAAIVERMG